MSPDPFITTQDVVDILGRGGTADPGMIIAVDAACDTVRTLAERQFNYGTTTVTLDGTGTDALLLPELPVANAGTVTVNGTAVTDYKLNDNGVLFRTAGTALTWCGGYWPEGRQNITVTFEHGYADVPRDARMVALNLACRMITAGMASSEQVGDVQISYAESGMDVTPGELRILQKYRPIR